MSNKKKANVENQDVVEQTENVQEVEAVSESEETMTAPRAKHAHRSKEERVADIDAKIASIKEHIESSKKRIKDLEKKKADLLNPTPRKRTVKLNEFEQVLVSRGASEKTAKATYRMLKKNGMDENGIRSFLNID